MLSRQMYKIASRRCRSITTMTISKRSQSITTTKINDRQLLLIDGVAHPRARYIDDSICMRSFNTVNCISGSSSSSMYDCSHDVRQLKRHMIICTSYYNNLMQSSLQYNTTKYSSILQLKHQRHQQHFFSTFPNSDTESSSIKSNPQTNRLSKIRNVGIFAHVDAGKTTVTERMLALSGLIHNTGSVDTGDTVTDYLPAERERGITIQSAAVCFDWIVPPSSPTTTSTSNNSSSIKEPQQVSINLIDTPGHVDFSVEVHRSVAVLDGAVLVVDAVAGVQAQTETVWRAIRNTDSSSSSSASSSEAEEDNTGKDDNKSTTKRKNKSALHGSHTHEPLPTIMYINKMDREGSDFNYAIDTVKRKLHGSNPLVVQLPLYRVGSPGSSGVNGERGSTDGRVGRESLGEDIVAGTLNDTQPPPHGTFIGMIDLVNLRAIIYPSNIESSSMEDATPTVISLTTNTAKESNPTLVNNAMNAHRDLISNLANVDEVMEDLYLEATMEDEDNFNKYISTIDIQSSLKRMTLQRKVMPTLCGAALRGLGVEPVLDCVAEYLPCPLDRLPPRLSMLGNNSSQQQKQKKQQQQQSKQQKETDYTLGHPLNTSTLAYVFKVLHMKGRGGSGDGRVAFARVYSGILKARDSVRVISPSNINSSSADGKNKKQKHPVERIGGMLELVGGTFGNLPEGSCRSGDVCALVGLKSVVTGDTLLLTSAGSDASDNKKKTTKKNKKGNDIHVKQYMDGVHLAGLTSPRPVLTLRVEANSASEQSRLSAALALLVVEDPSLVVEETATTTLISGLGELHMEIVLDRLRREFGVEVRTGKPAVAYREMVLLEDGEVAETDGLLEYDRTVGGVRLQGAVHLQLRQSHHHDLCIAPEDPTVSMSSKTREYFNLDPNPSSSDDESEHKYSPALRALLSGVRGSLKRGRLGPYPLANMECHIVDVDTELSSQETLPGSMRAAAANAVTTLLETMAKEDRMLILEPKMNVEISVPTGRVGDVLSDLTGRRGTVNDVAMADEGNGGDHVKSMVRAEVPLLEILGYANSLRSLTGGEGAFSAEYKGHAPQEGM